MGKLITQDTIRQLIKSPPATGNKVVWDGEGKGAVTGFGARITAAGSVAFVLRYVVDGRERRITLGKYPDLSVSAARDEAAKLRGDVTKGADPLADREDRRRTPTITVLCDRYVAEHLKVHNKPRTQAEFERLVEKRIKPKLGHHKVTALARRDVKEWHHAMRETPTEANRSLAVLRKILSLAVVDWELRDDNPARSIKLFPENKRERVLSDDELKRLGETVAALVASGEITEAAADCVWLLTVTGCRLSEILNLRWEDVDTSNLVLNIRDAKAGARSHQLGAVVAARLSALAEARKATRADWVLPSSTPIKPLSVAGMEHYWQRIRERAGLAGVRLHDLRHGYGTEAGNTGANAFQVRDALGHKTLAMTGRYVNRAGDAARQLADRVAGRLDAVWGGSSGATVVPLRKPAGGAA